ncbi:MAG: hypothetical protein LDL39_06395 [Magnetospirillum sp.]|nr:hypothetical protein [Magnetospirillum sp.]
MAAEMKQYTVQILQTADGYVLRVPELCLIEECSDLTAGWARLQERGGAVLDGHRRHGLIADVPPPAQLQAQGERDLRRFAIKAGIVALALVVVMSAAAIAFSYAMRDPLKYVGQRLGRAAVGSVVAGLREGTADLSDPARQQKFRQLLAEAAPVLRPYVAEIRQALALDCQSSKPQ